MRKYILTFIFCLFCFNAFATDYFVKTAGSDSNTGLSDAQAWETIDRVNNKSWTLNAGDNIYFKRGNTWREQLKFYQVNGTSANPITISAYGTGNKPKFYGSIDGGSSGYWTSLGSNKWASANDSFANESFMIFYDTNATQAYCKRETTEGGLNANWDFWYDSTNDRVVIYHSVGNPANQADGIEIAGIFNETTDGRIVFIQSSSYIEVSNLDLRYGNEMALRTYQSSYITFSDCDIYYTYDQAVNLDTDVNDLLENLYLYHNGYKGELSDSRGENIWIATNTDTVIKNCEVSNPHAVGINVWDSDGIIIEDTVVHDMHPYSVGSGHHGIYIDRSDNSIVQRNKVFNCLGGFGVNAEGAGTTADNNIFRNNIAYNNRQNYTTYNNQLADDKITNTKFYNNTSYIPYADGTSPYPGDFSLLYATNTTLKNNLIFGIDTASADYLTLLVSDSPGIVLDYNCWYLPNASNFVMEGTTYTTFAEYQTATGQDANSIAQDPLFDGGQYALQSGSPCIDAGADLWNITHDFRRLSRPQGAGFDIGYFEFGGLIEIDGITIDGIKLD